MNKNIFLKLVIIFCIYLSFNEVYSQNSKKDYSYSFDKVKQFSHNNNDSLIFYAVKMQESVNQCEKISGVLYEARGHYQDGDLEKSKKIVLNFLHLQESRSQLCQLKNLINRIPRRLRRV